MRAFDFEMSRRGFASALAAGALSLALVGCGGGAAGARSSAGSAAGSAASGAAAESVEVRVASLKGELLTRENLYILHSTGADGFEETERALALTPEEAQRYRVQPYIDNMGDMLAAADLVLSRSGASSVAEIAALAVPSVLVPYPHATADHQTTNARYLVDAGAGVLCADADIDGSAFADELLHLVDDAAARDAMRQAARGLAQDRAAALLADAVEGLR